MWKVSPEFTYLLLCQTTRLELHTHSPSEDRRRFAPDIFHVQVVLLAKCTGNIWGEYTGAEWVADLQMNENRLELADQRRVHIT